MFRKFRWAAVAIAVLAVAGTAVLAQSLRYSEAPTRIEVRATQITSFDVRDASRQRFGSLEFRGGLEMTSQHRAFGGISGLVMQPHGAGFLAVTDNGSWLRGRISYDGDGRPSGLTATELSPLLDAEGKPLAARGWFDAESLTLDGDTAYVGFERVEQIVKFNVGRDGLAARGEPIPVPPDFRTFKFNRSLECLAMVPKGLPLAGRMIVVAENSLDDNGNHRAFVLNGANTERFSVRKTEDFEVSDCAILPPGDVLLLERRYTPATGVAIRIRRVALASIKPGVLADGAVLMEADMGYQIDNMEGLGIHRNARGETILTLISDDNFSAIQRNLLLQFALIEP